MVIHNGHELSQAQLDCMTIVLNEQLGGQHKGMKKFKAAFERKCKERGCPIPEEVGPKGPDPSSKRRR